MMKILEIRQKIYNHFHASKGCSEYFFSSERADDYATYYTSMYLLQDTSEALLTHMECGFTKSLVSYIEFWGIMQAIIIQQDCIKNLYEIIKGSGLWKSPKKSWWKIRNLRNMCAGHPIDQGTDEDEDTGEIKKGKARTYLYGEKFW
ncbi:MAG: hypothetical protein QM752_02095 [Gammaproteobacteria bacterium]